jgi:uncharacterized protein (DUF924 family)
LTQPATYAQILRFWFDEIDPAMWWLADPTFDAKVRERFLATHQQAVRGELSGWRTESKGRLAEIIVLDQFSRNLFRNTPLAFAQDLAALVLAQEAVAADAHRFLSPIERSFLYLPFVHSESRQIHEWAERLYRANGLPENYDFELKHKVIIDRFGRYPHRNEILGRESTADEIEFLKEAGSSF